MLRRSACWSFVAGGLGGSSVESVAIPEFGTARARRRRASEQAAVLGAHVARTADEAECREAEDDAWAAVSARYGFRLKPRFLSWRAFLCELRRFELSWQLVDDDATLVARIADFGPDGGDAEARELLRWRCATRLHHSPTTLIDGLRSLMTDDGRAAMAWPPLPLSFAVPFVDDTAPGIAGGMRSRVLHVRGAVHALAATRSSDPIGTALEVAVSTDNDNIRPGLLDSLLAQQARRQSAGLAAADAPVVPGRTELFSVSAQTLAYATLTSMVRLAEGTDLLMPNRAYMDYAALKAAEDVWHQLRGLACMHMAPWPLAARLLKGRTVPPQPL